MDNEICGTCKYHRTVDGEWTCLNEESDYYGIETEYTDACEDWEGRDYGTVMLKKCREELRDILMLSDRREVIAKTLLPRAIRYTHDKIQTTPEDYFSAAMARLADFDEYFNKRLGVMLTRQLEAQEMIDRLSDGRQREILTLYYLSYVVEERGPRLHTWADVAKKTCYGIAHVKRLHKEALKNICLTTHS